MTSDTKGTACHGETPCSCISTLQTGDIVIEMTSSIAGASSEKSHSGETSDPTQPSQASLERSRANLPFSNISQLEQGLKLYKKVPLFGHENVSIASRLAFGYGLMKNPGRTAITGLLIYG